MTTFQIEKGSKFEIEKGIKQIQVGLGWDAQEGVDLDGSVFDLVHLPGGQPKFYGDGSHAVCYANTAAKQPDGTIQSMNPRSGTPDGAIKHSGDAREGGGGDAPDEIIDVDFSKMPDSIVELAVWITIYHAKKNGTNFSHVHKSYLRITDANAPGQPLAQYDLGKEFGQSTAVQVGSFVKETGLWSFTAIGAGAPVEIGEVLGKYE